MDIKTFIKKLPTGFYNRIGIHFYALFYNVTYKPWIELLGKADKRKLKYTVSLCLIFKNEAPFLKEWLDYHITIGISHFYLYNNNSDDDYYNIIRPYIENGYVTLVNWPKMHAQMEAYEDCINRFGQESNWIGFIDADEFICMKYELDIKQYLNKFRKYPALNIQWLIFGSDGRMEHDYSKNVIEQYHTCWNHFYQYGKTIVNTRYKVANFNTMYAHHHSYMFYKILGLKVVVPAVNQWGWICRCGSTWGGGFDKIRNSSIQINHYYSKAWNIYAAKMDKSDVFFDKNPKGAQRYYRNECQCITTNYTISRFLIRMKLLQRNIELKKSEF